MGLGENVEARRRVDRPKKKRARGGPVAGERTGGVWKIDPGVPAWGSNAGKLGGRRPGGSRKLRVLPRVVAERASAQGARVEVEEQLCKAVSKNGLSEIRKPRSRAAPWPALARYMLLQAARGGHLSMTAKQNPG